MSAGRIHTNASTATAASHLLLSVLQHTAKPRTPYLSSPKGIALGLMVAKVCRTFPCPDADFGAVIVSSAMLLARCTADTVKRCGNCDSMWPDVTSPSSSASSCPLPGALCRIFESVANGPSTDLVHKYEVFGMACLATMKLIMASSYTAQTLRAAFIQSRVVHSMLQIVSKDAAGLESILGVPDSAASRTICYTLQNMCLCTSALIQRSLPLQAGAASPSLHPPLAAVVHTSPLFGLEDPGTVKAFATVLMLLQRLVTSHTALAMPACVLLDTIHSVIGVAESLPHVALLCQRLSRHAGLIAALDFFAAQTDADATSPTGARRTDYAQVAGKIAAALKQAKDTFSATTASVGASVSVAAATSTVGMQILAYRTDVAAHPESAAIRRRCAHCHQSAAEDSIQLQKCGACQKVRYCSKVCQRAALDEHRRVCPGMQPDA